MKKPSTKFLLIFVSVLLLLAIGVTALPYTVRGKICVMTDRKICIKNTLSYIQNEAPGKMYSWRYKMTVSVETPEGIKTGSAVREVSAKMIPTPHDVMRPFDFIKKRVAGEAVVVDLGERGVLFAIMKGPVSEDYAHSIVFDAFPYRRGGFTREGAEYYSKLKNVKATLKTSQYPLLVTFTDLNDPKTIKHVLEIDPGAFSPPYKNTIKKDNFEEYFGKEVKLKEITIEMTDEPVTHQIEKYLPPFGNIPRPIGRYYFKRGIPSDE